MNNSIGGNNSLDLNEKLMNTIYINMLKGEYDSVDVDCAYLVMIENLANSCPFINGYGVYKARILTTMLGNYTNFNDSTLCNAAVQNKNSDGTDEEPIIDPNLLSLIKEGNIKVYPNPFNGQITIDYYLKPKEKGAFVIYDITGIEKLRIDLSPIVNRTSFNVSNMPKGIYIYKYVVNNIMRGSGKLIKE